MTPPPPPINTTISIFLLLCRSNEGSVTYEGSPPHSHTLVKVRKLLFKLRVQRENLGGREYTQKFGTGLGPWCWDVPVFIRPPDAFFRSVRQKASFK